MKKVFSICLTFMLLISLAGCSNQENSKAGSDGASVEIYLDKAQAFMDQGDYSSAIELLEKGYEITKDERLATLLADAYANQLESGNGTTPPTIGQQDPTDVLDTTDPSKPQQPDSETTDTTINSSLHGPDISRIQEDLIEQGENSFYIDYEDVELSVDSIEVLRRKSGEKNDEIHVAVSFSNEYYIVNEELTLFYSYYDVGGWYLDDYIITSYQSRAINNPVSNEDFLEMLSYQFDSYSIDSRVHEISADGTYYDYITFSVSVEYEYLVVWFKGTYTYAFMDSMWIQNHDMWIANYDWSKLQDTFVYRNRSLNMGACFYSAEVTVSISKATQLAGNELKITYSGSTYLYNKTASSKVADEDVPETTRTIKLHTEKEYIWGTAFEIPYYGGCLYFPWEWSSEIEIYVDRSDGLYTCNLLCNGSKDEFVRNVSNDELQDALDQLQGMNP